MQKRRWPTPTSRSGWRRSARRTKSRNCSANLRRGEANRDRRQLLFQFLEGPPQENQMVLVANRDLVDHVVAAGPTGEGARRTRRRGPLDGDPGHGAGQVAPRSECRENGGWRALGQDG